MTRPPKTKRQTIFLTEPQTDLLKREAEKLGITISDLVRRIIDEWRGGRP
jgi:hypothetical protein